MIRLLLFVGPSGSGKDTALSAVLNKYDPQVKRLVQYTTRPIRENEIEGVDYHFINNNDLRRRSMRDNAMSTRKYNTVHGTWTYVMQFTEDMLKEVTFTEFSSKIVTYATTCTAKQIVDIFCWLIDKPFRTNVILHPIFIRTSDLDRFNALVNRSEGKDIDEIRRRQTSDTVDFSENIISVVKEMCMASSVRSYVSNANNLYGSNLSPYNYYDIIYNNYTEDFVESLFRLPIFRLIEKENGMGPSVEITEQFDLSPDQTRRVDIIYNAVYDTCKIIAEKDLEWNMSYIGPIADMIVKTMLDDRNAGLDRIRFPYIDDTGVYDYIERSDLDGRRFKEHNSR